MSCLIRSTSTSCSGYNLSDPRAEGPVRVFSAGTPGVRCYWPNGNWTYVNISQVWEIDGGSWGTNVLYKKSNGTWAQEYIVPNSYRMWTWGGPGVFLEQLT